MNDACICKLGEHSSWFLLTWRVPSFAYDSGFRECRWREHPCQQKCLLSHSRRTPSSNVIILPFIGGTSRLSRCSIALLQPFDYGNIGSLRFAVVTYRLSLTNRMQRFLSRYRRLPNFSVITWMQSFWLRGIVFLQGKFWWLPCKVAIQDVFRRDSSCHLYRRSTWRLYRNSKEKESSCHTKKRQSQQRRKLYRQVYSSLVAWQLHEASPFFTPQFCTNKPLHSCFQII